MVYPECANLLVGRGKGKVILYHRVREECRVEVDADTPVLCELYPFCEVLRLKLISVGKFAVFKDRIACVKIELLLARNEGESLVDISHKLVGCCCLAGIVARCLYSAGQSLL